MTVSIQGFKGSNHDVVARGKFGNDVTLLERKTFRKVFEDVARGRADYAVAAVENSIAGSILETYDLLLKSDVVIIGEAYLRIAHQLIAHPRVGIEDIREVRSHPMALKQCRAFLDMHPSWKVVEDIDTAGAVARIKEEGTKEVAAIASRLAAELHGMQILTENIETDPENYTRFFVLAKPGKDSVGAANKTSLVFTAAHKSGSLAGILSAFAAEGINLTKIESRPIVGKTWEYYFYVDFEAGMEDERTKRVFETIAPLVTWHKVLGWYEKGNIQSSSQK